LHFSPKIPQRQYAIASNTRVCKLFEDDDKFEVTTFKRCREVCDLDKACNCFEFKKQVEDTPTTIAKLMTDKEEEKCRIGVRPSNFAKYLTNSNPTAKKWTMTESKYSSFLSTEAQSSDVVFSDGNDMDLMLSGDIVGVGLCRNALSNSLTNFWFRYEFHGQVYYSQQGFDVALGGKNDNQHGQVSCQKWELKERESILGITVWQQDRGYTGKSDNKVDDMPIVAIEISTSDPEKSITSLWGGSFPSGAAFRKTSFTTAGAMLAVGMYGAYFRDEQRFTSLGFYFRDAHVGQQIPKIHVAQSNIKAPQEEARAAISMAST
jgi:hypothetical protein